MDTARMIHISNFKELSVKRMRPHFKDDKKLLEFIPDYKESQLPEIDFFYGVLCYLYNDEISSLVKESYRYRRDHYVEGHDESIILTQELKDRIDSILSYKSKLSYLSTSKATKGRGLALLKVKNKNQRAPYSEVEFKPDLSAFRRKYENAPEKYDPDLTIERSKYGNAGETNMDEDFKGE